MAFENNFKCICRRDFLKTAGAWALAAGMGANIILPDSAHAGNKKLKISLTQHTDPDYDVWFKNFAEEWGKKYDTKVVIDWHDCE